MVRSCFPVSQVDLFIWNILPHSHNTTPSLRPFCRRTESSGFKGYVTIPSSGSRRPVSFVSTFFQGLVKEQLTACNVPCCQCCICLYGFRQGDHFTKTPCYHYFHSHCLAKHLRISHRIFNEEQDKLPAWQRTDTFQVGLLSLTLSSQISILSMANVWPSILGSPTASSMRSRTSCLPGNAQTLSR
ncbi:NF-kappaB binding [Homalodisca vitripennis]|nr:NF-kappaB binding [Homalodisca vitripennis]